MSQFMTLAETFLDYNNNFVYINLLVSYVVHIKIKLGCHGEM